MCALPCVFPARSPSLPRVTARIDPTLSQVYLSRIPPYMKPVKIAQLLEKYGELGRVYLAPEGAGTARNSFATAVGV